MIYQNSVICFLDASLNKKELLNAYYGSLLIDLRLFLLTLMIKRRSLFPILETITIYYTNWNLVAPKLN